MTSASPALSTAFYYDALGHQVASYRPALQNEIFWFDVADNRTMLNAFQTDTPKQIGLIRTYEALLEGQGVTSSDGRFTLTLQTDGNLVLYQGSTVLWSSATGQRWVGYAVMQNDGELVINDPQGKTIWTTGTSNDPGAYLQVETNGNVQIFYNGAAVWSTNTCCH